jgi:hypothetical protein
MSFSPVGTRVGSLVGIPVGSWLGDADGAVVGRPAIQRRIELNWIRSL